MNKIVLKWIGTLSFLIVFSLLKTFNSFGCSTPVFRYALEMWPAFNYKVEVVHNGNLSETQLVALKKLKEASTGVGITNLTVEESSDFNKYKLESGSSPQILLFHPTEHRNNKLVWQGDLTEENINKLIDSPARQQILANIKKGDAISWVLIKSNDEVKNLKATNTLDSELKLLSKKLKLATDATDVDGNPLDIDVINKGVNFSMVSVSRDDPAEEVFVQILLSTEADLPYIKAPLAFPVFGRGRVLYALVGNGIKSKLIETACNSVIGWCSCTIKEDNPGSDLLFSADWDKITGDSSWVKPVELPEITGMSGFIQEQEVEKKAENQTSQAVLNTDKKTAEYNKKQEVVKEEIDPEEKQQTPVVVDKQEVREKSIATTIAETQQKRKSPLKRNIIIVVLLLLIILPTISILLRKKRSHKNENQTTGI